MLFLKIDNKYLRLEKARSHKYIERRPDVKGGFLYIYSKKSNDRNDAINYEDIREFGYDKALQIKKDIESIRNQTIEYAQGYDKNGNPIFNKSGDKKEINFSIEDQDRIENSRLLIHNHPTGNSFSDDDINLIFRLNIQEIRSCGQKYKTKTDFSLKITKNIPLEVFQEILNEYRRYWIKNEKLNPDTIAHRTMLFITENIEYKGYFKYDKIK